MLETHKWENIALQYQHVFKGTSTKKNVVEQHHMKFEV
jgi:hypothetical protein